MSVVETHVHCLVWIVIRRENIFHHGSHVAVVLFCHHRFCSEGLVDFAPSDFEFGFTNALTILINSLFKNKKGKKGQSLSGCVVNGITHTEDMSAIYSG